VTSRRMAKNVIVHQVLLIEPWPTQLDLVINPGLVILQAFAVLQDFGQLMVVQGIRRLLHSNVTRTLLVIRWMMNLTTWIEPSRLFFNLHRNWRACPAWPETPWIPAVASKHQPDDCKSMLGIMTMITDLKNGFQSQAVSHYQTLPW